MSKNSKLTKYLFDFVIVNLVLPACLLLYPIATNVLAQDKKTPLLTKILHIGKEDSPTSGPDPVIFGTILSVAVDDSDFFYIVDTRQKIISKFNEQGILKFRLSNIGQGPGEFLNPFIGTFSNNNLYVFDLRNRKIIVYDKKGEFKREFSLPYWIYSLHVTEDETFYASGIIYAKGTDLTNHNLIHLFDSTGKQIKSFGAEIKFDVSHIKHRGPREIAFEHYAGIMLIYPWDNYLLVSPIFDSRTYVYNLNGDLIKTFTNPAFDYKLLNYKIRGKRGVLFSAFESQAGPAIQFDQDLILKSYQVSLEEEHLEYYLDIFNKEGKILLSQFPIKGKLLNVSSNGNLYLVKNHPYPQIWVYHLNTEVLQNYLN